MLLHLRLSYFYPSVLRNRSGTLRDYVTTQAVKFFFLTAWQCITVLKSFIINRVLTKEIITVTVFGYLMVISRDFYDFFSPISP